MEEVPTVHLVGNAHLDPVWLWRWQEGYAEVKATFRSALDRLEEFPEFMFTSACAAYYKWVEESDPEMFREIKKKVEEGRWVIVGGWWIQPDCNLPCGESFVRQGLYGQRYFLKKFGQIARIGYNVDSFGHSGMLPQILSKCGMDSYVFMRPNSSEKELPGEVFWWESRDGSRVLACRIPFSYGPWLENIQTDDPEEFKLRQVVRLARKKNIDLMNFYGVGNHGGGPTIKNITMLKRLQKEYRTERILFSSPVAFFDALKRKGTPLPVVRDDLQYHAVGCYSAHSEIKANNRRAEHRLVAAEKFAALAGALCDFSYPRDLLEHAWETVLFNQFHDLLGGCSIKDAYEDAREFHGEALSIGARIINAAVQRLSWQIDTQWAEKDRLSKEDDWALWETGDAGIPLVLFNPLSWEVISPVQVNKKLSTITDEAGELAGHQLIRAPRTNQTDKWDTLFMARLPALGYTVYRVYKNLEHPLPSSDAVLRARVTPEAATLENDFLRIEIELNTGWIKRIYEKANGVEVLKGQGAVPLVIDECQYDTWAHGATGFGEATGRFGNARVEVIEKGPLRSFVRVISRYNASILQQDFMLYAGGEEVEVRATLDWREKHKLLKLSFPVNVIEPKAYSEIPYGFIERTTDGTEQPGQQWYDVTGVLPGASGRIYGMSLITDTKYAFDVEGSRLRLTVVRSPLFADHFGERDEQGEFMDQGRQEFRYGLLPHNGACDPSQVVKKAYEFNGAPVQVIETYHRGSLPLRISGIEISSDSVVASAFKIAEDDDDFILRCYETSGNSVTTTIEIPPLRRKWEANFVGCEIKTFRIPRTTESPIIEVDFLERV